MKAAIAALALLAGCSAVTPQPGTTASRFVPKACPATLTAEQVQCGSVTVPENYASASGRNIDLNVVVFRALEPGNERGAQFDLEGGPGFGVTDSWEFYAGEGAMYRKHRDVVLFDMRGTGGSGALLCPGIEAYETSQTFPPLYPPHLVKECAASLSQRADLRQYTTAAAARDIDAVRQALGYEWIDLNALSYGTTLALRYIADHPDRVRTAVLTGTVPADRTPPRHHATAAERGLRMLLEACAAEPDCAATYPDPDADLRAALQRLPEESRPEFLEKVRNRLYSAEASRGVPLLLKAAAGGDFTAFRRERRRVFADGLYISITCAESLARMDVDEAIAASGRTRFGAYRIKRQRDACAEWSVAAPDARLFDAPRSDVPVLFISGAFDPVSPPEWAEDALKRFRNGRHLLVPQGAHVPDGLSNLDTCLDRLVPEFVAKRSAQGLDAACLATMAAPAFH